MERLSGKLSGRGTLKGGLSLGGGSPSGPEIDILKNAIENEGIGYLDENEQVVKIDKKFLPAETDPVFTNSPAYGITSEDITNWDNKFDLPASGIPKGDLAESVQDSLELADTALQSYTETDPTVPSWAKQQNKPSYTASEVGAIPDSYLVVEIDEDSTDLEVPTAKAVYNAIVGIGTVFTIKGSVQRYSLLPVSGNKIGDVYYVENDEVISGTLYPGEVGYVWITVNNVDKWEELGQTIDVSEFLKIEDLASSTGQGEFTAMTQKAVSDALSGKQDSLPTITGNSGKVLETDGSQLFWGNKQIYIAVYGTTTYADALAAYNSGQIILCKNGSEYIFLENYSSSQEIFYFYCIKGTTSYSYRLTTSGWATGTFYLASTSSPTFTGEPEAPTAVTGTDTTQIATTAFVNASIAAAITAAIGDEY